ncbi:uncharacterized protein LOC100371592 [Saccoglossus kowalevskii]|uniref:Slit homolog 2 protein-like n=1 Tax=Saccoglossus kowalevskii TaxID=10224 RepID=A0ABM0GZI1_SACKO|nr:PREDICTED: slit homolog 2 protein-like [Saccoglossus kowalevskii]
MDAINAFNCTCVQGFTGLTCADDVDECIMGNPCKGNRACVNLRGGYKCECKEGFIGDGCMTPIELCDGTPCINGACVNKDDTVRCGCYDNYFGESCQYELPYYGYSVMLIGDVTDVDGFENDMGITLITALQADEDDVVVTVMEDVRYIADETRTELTKLTFIVLYDDGYISAAKISELLSTFPQDTMEHRIGYKLYEGEAEPVTDPVNEDDDDRGQLSANWYIILIVIIILICIIIVIVAAVLVYRRKRVCKKQIIENDYVDMDPMQVAFENKVYSDLTSSENVTQTSTSKENEC